MHPLCSQTISHIGFRWYFYVCFSSLIFFQGPNERLREQSSLLTSEILKTQALTQQSVLDLTSEMKSYYFSVFNKGVQMLQATASLVQPEAHLFGESAIPPVSERKHFCVFCLAWKSQINRHLFTCHSHEPDVLQAKNLQHVNHKLYIEKMRLLRHRGRKLHQRHACVGRR